ncbi:hypothetical protein BMR85_026495 [Achromobacter sp. KAs 3-5]|nr:hypothetical protein BMR85_026495 [Achromobacter sp. KAs 3-5]
MPSGCSSSAGSPAGAGAAPRDCRKSKSVFNQCSATGWGRTNESRKILTDGLTPETREFLKDKGGVFPNGTAHKQAGGRRAARRRRPRAARG